MLLLKACVNGPRLPAEHAALPVTAEQIAADVARVVAAGADAVHLHAKDETGADTLAAETVAAVLTAVRAAAPRVPVGLTTGAWAAPDPAERVREIAAWTVHPDFASVNWHEPGAADVATLLLSRGVAVEAGLWHADAVGAWLRSEHRLRCCRVLIELPDGLGRVAAETEADALLAAVSSAGADVPVLLHGEGTSAWPTLRYAGQLGLQTRIGLEDVLELPDGSPAADNAALVAAARRLLDRT